MTGLCSVMKKRASIGHGRMEYGSRKRIVWKIVCNSLQHTASKGKAVKHIEI